MLSAQITELELYGLVFLLGSYTVSSLSDIRRMAAQRDFAEVWGVFTVAAFALEVLGASEETLAAIMIKWGMIIGFILLNSGRSPLLKIALMDVLACTALFSMLPPAALAATAVAMIIINELLTPLLKSYGQGAAYPFLPVVWLTNLLIIIAVLGGVL